MSQIIDGKMIAQKLRADLKEEIKKLKEKYNKVPGLAVVQIGNVAASSVYVKAKTKSAFEPDYPIERGLQQYINRYKDFANKNVELFKNK